MSPTPVTFTSPVLPTAYTWEATNEQVAERYGVPIDAIVRFDLNTSPTPPALVDRLLAAGQFDTLSEYPPSDYRRLTEAAAARYGVGTDELLVGAGADEVLDLVAKAFLAEGSRAVLPAPTYAMYRVLTEQRRAGVVTVPRRPPAEGWALDIDAVRAAARGATSSGCAVRTTRPGWPSRTAPSRRSSPASPPTPPEPPIVVLDEAYAEFVGTTLLPLRDAYPRLIVVHRQQGLCPRRAARRVRDRRRRGHRPDEPVPPARVGVDGFGDDRDRGAARSGDPREQPRTCHDRARPPGRRADRGWLVGRAERDELPAGRLRFAGACRRNRRGSSHVDSSRARSAWGMSSRRTCASPSATVTRTTGSSRPPPASSARRSRHDDPARHPRRHRPR